MAETKNPEPIRMCDSCGQVDDHPRHVWHHGDGDGLTDVEVGVKALAAAKDPLAYETVLRHMRDNSTIMKHMDCCRVDGCPDGLCNEVTKGAEDKKGDALRRHLKKEK